ncbi:MAG: hypothetical protein JW976_08085 [Syntrophaceae bacterium]|nr:hypothetical protein [Syntrophaceae bacterium]
MKNRIVAAIVFLFCSLFWVASINAANGWTKVKESSGIKLYERPVTGTDLEEYMVVTTMDAKMEVIGDALRDVAQYTQWLSDHTNIFKEWKNAE